MFFKKKPAAENVAALIEAIVVFHPKPTWHRCMICRNILIEGHRIHESFLGVSSGTPYDWPSAGISDGFCGDECKAIYRKEYC